MTATGGTVPSSKDRARAADLLRSISDRHANLLVRDAQAVIEKLATLRQRGGAGLHVIADFDMTLTRQFVDTPGGKERNHSSHAVLERGPHVSRHFAELTRSLIKKYYPHEIDPRLDRDTKTRLMVEWWTQAHDAILKERITRQTIRDQAIAVNLPFRDRCREVVELLSSERIPLLIFSAGLGDVIEEILKVASLRRDDQYIVSNHMTFDSHGTAIAFREPLIHSLNKGEVALQADSEDSRALDAVLADRRNVILVGDSPGDVRMADGAKNDAVLKIGFLNFGDAERRDEFLQLYDVVITDDGDMSVLEEILKHVVT